MVKETPGIRDLLQSQREATDTQGGSMYGHGKRSAVNAPRPSPRLTKEQRAEYQEELEYAHAQQQARGDAAYRAAMDEQYDAQPGRRTQPTAYERISSSARGLAARASVAGNRALNAGARAAEGVSAIGQNPHIRQMSQQSGFINRNIPPAQPRHATARQQYAGAPVHDNSVMHPGNRIVVMRCSEATGKCKTIATGISEERPRQPRRARRPAYYRGGLGEGDYGL